MRLLLPVKHLGFAGSRRTPAAPAELLRLSSVLQDCSLSNTIDENVRTARAFDFAVESRRADAPWNLVDWPVPSR